MKVIHALQSELPVMGIALAYNRDAQELAMNGHTADLCLVAQDCCLFERVSKFQYRFVFMIFKKGKKVPDLRQRLCLQQEFC